MCGLAAAATAVAASSVIGGMLQGSATVEAGRAQNAADAANAAIAEGNANQKFWEARDAEELGNQERAAFGEQAGKTIARSKAAMATNAVDLSVGAPAQLIEQQHKDSYADQMRITANTERAVLTKANEGQNFLQQSALYKARSKDKSYKKAAWGQVLSGISGGAAGGASMLSLGG